MGIMWGSSTGPSLFPDRPLVLDLTRLLPGPYGTHLMAASGMDVLKIEHPEHGDELRTLAAGGGEESLAYRLLNGNKRLVNLDLRNPQDGERFLELADEADVLVENFRPGLMESMGVGYEELRERNPRLIYLSLGGYLGSPETAGRAAHDLNFLAHSGMLDNNGTDGPAMLGGPVADLGAGVALLGLAASALYRRSVEGEGVYLRLGVDELMRNWGAVTGAMLGAHVSLPPRGGSILTGAIVCYQVYEAADGHVALAALEPKFWRNLLEAADMPGLLDAQFASAVPGNPAYDAVAGYFAARTLAEIEEELGEVDCCLTPLRRLDQVMREEVGGGEGGSGLPSFFETDYRPAEGGGE